MTTQFWDTPQRILVFLAHPDDPEFFCGATIARWIQQGHTVSYCLFTHGEKGSQDPVVKAEDVAKLREQEQKRAGAVIGVDSIQFLNFVDGNLHPEMIARREAVRVIRHHKPDILVTCDPLNYFIDSTRLNHPDHRAAGQIVLDAAFPASGNIHFFPELVDAGYAPHQISEIWITHTTQPDIFHDVTDLWEIKIQALHEHVSQIGERSAFDRRMRNRCTPDSTPDHPRYEERFRRIFLAPR